MSALPCTHILAIPYLSIPVLAYTVRFQPVLCSGCLSPGNTEILGILVASVPQVVRPHGASQSAGLIHYERRPSGPSYHLMGLCVCVYVCVCVRQRKF